MPQIDVMELHALRLAVDVLACHVAPTTSLERIRAAAVQL
jgi:hypothetical protein